MQVVRISQTCSLHINRPITWPVNFIAAHIFDIRLTLLIKRLQNRKHLLKQSELNFFRRKFVL